VPLPAGSVALDGRSRQAYRALVTGFRERLTRALNSLTLGQHVEDQLEQELRLLAKELPSLRHRVEAASRGPRQSTAGPLDSGHASSLDLDPETLRAVIAQVEHQLAELDRRSANCTLCKTTD